MDKESVKSYIVQKANKMDRSSMIDAKAFSGIMLLSQKFSSKFLQEVEYIIDKYLENRKDKGSIYELSYEEMEKLEIIKEYGYISYDVRGTLNIVLEYQEKGEFSASMRDSLDIISFHFKNSSLVGDNDEKVFDYADIWVEFYMRMRELANNYPGENNYKE